ncbi:MAG: ATP-binding protein [Candidatus Micrarchaeia archaeon]
MQLTLENLLAEAFEVVANASNADALLQNYGKFLETRFDADAVMVQDVYTSQRQTSEFQEFIINTRKPYVDNKLSSYSAFSELVGYYNRGYKSSITLPAIAESKPVALLTLLSKSEEKFGEDVQRLLVPMAQLLGYAFVAKTERDRSVSLARYFDAAFNSRMPQLMLGSSGAIVKANKEFMELFGKTQKEVYGKPVTEFFDVSGQSLGALSNGSVLEARDKQGGRVFMLSGSAVSDSIVHVLAYDATRLKELEAELKIAEESQHEAFMLLNSSTGIIWASANTAKIFGIDAQELVGRKLSDLSQDIDIASCKQLPCSIVAKISTGNGNTVEAKLLFQKSYFGYSCVLANSSFDKYVSNVQNYIRNIAEVSADAIITVDSLGYVVSANKSAEKLLGYKLADISGSALSSLYFDDDSQRLLSSSLSLSKERGLVGSAFVNLRTRTGEALPCEQSVLRLVDESNSTTGYMLIYKELATKRLVETLQDDLDKANRQASNYKAESDLKTQFIYNISHDLKTPLTNIKGFAKLLYEGSFGELSAEQNEHLNIIISESERLMQLIQQILDVAKLSSGKIKLDLQKIRFEELGNNPSIKSLAEMAQKKGLAFEWHVDYNVPEFIGDPNRIIQVLVNLIGNAVKFTEHGGIRVSAFRKGKNVRVEVSDTGIGISKEDKAKLFRKFYQLQHKGLTKQEGSGTGLGLVIAKEIVNLHGGKIGVISEPGKGSTFWFTLPIYGKKHKEKQQKGAEQSQQGEQQH